MMRRVLRPLLTLPLALALHAIPATDPQEASARRMSEGQAMLACFNAGGTGRSTFWTRTPWATSRRARCHRASSSLAPTTIFFRPA